MTSTSMVAVFFSLAAASQVVFCTESEPTQSSLKEHHRHQVLAQASIHHHTVASLPGKREKQDYSEPHMAHPESSAMAPEARSRDDNEQFTRMSCCP